MSRFNGVDFKVIPENNQFYPSFELDNDGFWWWSGDIYVVSQSNLDALRNSVTIFTVKRPRGAISAVIHIDAGISSKQLKVPRYGGSLKTVSALLQSLSNVRSYAKAAGGGTMDEQFTCSAKFLITSDPTG